MTIPTEIKDLTQKAIIHFKEFYSDKDNRRTLNLRDFVVYAIIRGKKIDSPIIDSNYTDERSALFRHKKFNYSLSCINSFDNRLSSYLNYPLKSYYSDSLTPNRIKMLFGLDKEETTLLFDFYFSHPRN